MPILYVRIVGPASSDQDNLASSIADAAGAVFKSGPNQTWVIVEPVPISRYAENEGGPPGGVCPVIVSVLKRQIPAAHDDLNTEVGELTKAIAAACGRPRENVHLIYEPPGAGRVVFGGKLVE